VLKGQDVIVRINGGQCSYRMHFETEPPGLWQAGSFFTLVMSNPVGDCSFGGPYFAPIVQWFEKIQDLVFKPGPGRRRTGRPAGRVRQRLRQPDHDARAGWQEDAAPSARAAQAGSAGANTEAMTAQRARCAIQRQEAG
jgi:hypothetical protein